MSNKVVEKQRPYIVGQAFGVVLEIGFGSGLNLPYYKNINKLYAIDPSRELYNLAEERIKETFFPVEYLPVSAEKIPLADNSIDSVVSTWNLCSISHTENTLKEIFRVLKPNGIFLFIEHGKSSSQFIFNVQKLLTPSWKHIAGGCCLDKEIDKLISDVGFEIQKLEKSKQKFKPLNFLYKGIAVARK
ncbi:MAG: class I SAM-dependent methyltransferase [Patescibacteria group bacterium]